MKLRILLAALSVLAVVLILFLTRPVFHLARTFWSDVEENFSTSEGAVNDASKLDETRVAEVWQIPTDPKSAEEQLGQLLQRARTNHLKVAIAGARHSMGGHVIYPGGIVIDMLPFADMTLNESDNILHAQAGARWSRVIEYLNSRGRSVAIMQSDDDFSVGGSISVNCHGWQFARPPMASSVESFHVMLANGGVVNCSRKENQELFSLVLGGYGLFGIILDVDLRVVPNEKYNIERLVVSSADYANTLNEKVGKKKDIALVYGRLNVTAQNFLSSAVLNIFHLTPDTNKAISTLGETKFAALKRAVFRGSVGDDYGKKVRWQSERWLDSYLSGEDFERNSLLHTSAKLFQNHSKDSTDILMECFVPPGEFEPFLADLRKIIPETHADLLNVTVRHVNKDEDTFLRYADKDMFSLVMLFNQRCDASGETNMANAAKKIIDAALKHSGRYYLPYRLHATPGQFLQAYPQAVRFFELKRKYDPEELFQNQFYQKYGEPLTARIAPK